MKSQELNYNCPEPEPEETEENTDLTDHSPTKPPPKNPS